MTIFGFREFSQWLRLSFVRIMNAACTVNSIPISANSFRGNYSFLNSALFTVTFDLYLINLNSCRGKYSREETIQGRKLFAEIRYLKKSTFQFCFPGLLSLYPRFCRPRVCKSQELSQSKYNKLRLFSERTHGILNFLFF